MARNRVAYGILLMLSIAFVYVCPGEVSSALFYTLLSLPPLSLLLSSAIYFLIRISQSAPHTVIRGETAAFTFSIHNQLPLLCPLEVQFYGGDTYLGQSLSPLKTALLPLGRTKVTIPLGCRHIGCLRIGIRKIVLWDYLGLFALTRNIGQPLDLAVMPRIQTVRFPIGARALGGAETHQNHNIEEQVLSSDIRNYISGDRLKQVHWKLTAKKNDLLVRKMESETGPHVKLILNYAETGSLGEAAAVQRDVFLETALSLAHWFVRRKIGLMLITQTDAVRQSILHNREDVTAATHMLLDLRLSPQESVGSLFRWEGVRYDREDTVVVLSTSFSAELAGHCSALLSASAELLIVVADVSPEPERPEDRPASRGMRVLRIASPEEIGSALKGRVR